MSDISIDRAMQIGIEAGIRIALERIQKEKEDRIKHRYDKRLRNTKLLLRNLNNFKAHCENAVYTSGQLRRENALDLLDEYEDIDDDILYISSIKKTQTRTLIIIQHIERMLKFYKCIAENSNDENTLRRYKAINLFFLSDEKMTYDDIAEELNVSERTIFRDINRGVEELSSLIFGVDGIRLEV